LKPLHAKWIVKLFNEMTSESGKEVILKGWLKAGIADGIAMGKSKLPPLDPFHQIDPLVIEEQDYDLAQALTTSECPLYEGVTAHSSDEDSEWEDPDECGEEWSSCEESDSSDNEDNQDPNGDRHDGGAFALF